MPFFSANISPPQILRKGVLQVSEKERQAALESSFKEIASLVSNQTVDPGSKKPYPVTVIENAMKQAHFSVKPQRPAKLQALEVIKLLKESMPIERAQIRIQINFPVQFKLVKDQLEALVVLTEHLEVNSEVEMICLIEPGMWRKVEICLRTATKGAGILQILCLRSNENDVFG